MWNSNRVVKNIISNDVYSRNTKSGKYKIKVVGQHDLKDYGGMNYYAAKHLNFKPIPKKNEILIEKDNKNFMKSTIVHERIEAELMRKGMSYNQAHKKAIEAEINAGFVSKRDLIETNIQLSKRK